MMRATTIALIAGALLVAATTCPAADPAWADRYDSLLKKYRTSTGVDYRAWHGDAGDRQALAEIVGAIGSGSVAGLSKDERLAFYLNAYNANILNQILADYPTGGPGGGGLIGRNRFFKSRPIEVAGRQTNFHALENDVIRSQFEEPRIHFALNCASASCPPLHGKAFRAATLDATLTSLTKAFVDGNPEGVGAVAGEKVAISKIFDWYADDFKPAGGALAFINRYRTSKLPDGTKVSFQDYRWSLNEAR